MFFHVKHTTINSTTIPILFQSINGPCPLIALVNTLIINNINNNNNINHTNNNINILTSLLLSSDTVSLHNLLNMVALIIMLVGECANRGENRGDNRGENRGYGSKGYSGGESSVSSEYGKGIEGETYGKVGSSGGDGSGVMGKSGVTGEYLGSGGKGYGVESSGGGESGDFGGGKVRSSGGVTSDSGVKGVGDASGVWGESSEYGKRIGGDSGNSAVKRVGGDFGNSAQSGNIGGSGESSHIGDSGVGSNINNFGVGSNIGDFGNSANFGNSGGSSSGKIAPDINRGDSIDLHKSGFIGGNNDFGSSNGGDLNLSGNNGGGNSIDSNSHFKLKGGDFGNEGNHTGANNNTTGNIKRENSNFNNSDSNNRDLINSNTGFNQEINLPSAVSNSKSLNGDITSNFDKNGLKTDNGVTENSAFSAGSKNFDSHGLNIANSEGLKSSEASNADYNHGAGSFKNIDSRGLNNGLLNSSGTGSSGIKGHSANSNRGILGKLNDNNNAGKPNSSNTKPNPFNSNSDFAPKFKSNSSSPTIIDQLLSQLPHLATGLNVNPNLTNNRFKNDISTSLFSHFNIPLIHGWTINQIDSESFGDNYESLLDLIYHLKYFDQIQDYLALDEDENIDYNQFDYNSKKPIPHQLHSSSLELISNKRLIRKWLHLNQTQLTINGLNRLNMDLNDNEYCVFFRNNHFSTLFKKSSMEFYLLVTDSSFQSDSNKIVWQSLNSISGKDDLFFSGDFFPILEINDQNNDEDFEIIKKLQQEEDLRIAESMQSKFDKKIARTEKKDSKKPSFMKRKKDEKNKPKEKGSKEKEKDKCIIV